MNQDILSLGFLPFLFTWKVLYKYFLSKEIALKMFLQLYTVGPVFIIMRHCFAENVAKYMEVIIAIKMCITNIRLKTAFL